MATLYEKASQILAEKNLKLIPENIKKDVQIFDVLGAYQGGEGGAVKLFTTEQEMDADQSKQEGGLALVYGDNIQPVTRDSIFDTCVFPSQVVLDEPITSHFQGTFTGVDSSSMFYGNIMLDNTWFDFGSYGEQEINISYKSEDGITYNRQDSGAMIVEIGTQIKWAGDSDYSTWSNDYGKFMKTRSKYFGGVFQADYTPVAIKGNLLSDLTINTSSKEITPGTSINIPYSISEFENKIKTMANYIKTNYYASKTSISFTIFIKDDVVSFFSYDMSGGDTTSFEICFDHSTLQAINTMIYYTTSESTREYKFNFLTNEFIELNTDITLDTMTVSGYTRGYTTYFNNHYVIGRISYNSNNNEFAMDYTIRYWTTNYFGSSYTSSNKPAEVLGLKYLPIKSQLDATAEYVYNTIFYGKNGVETGTLGTIISSEFDDPTVSIYLDAQTYYDTLTPRVLTDSDKTINKNIRYIPCKTDGTPLFDTSAMTDMSSMFSNCTKLVEISLLDTSNVTTMYNMFVACASLTTIPLLDTSNVTNFGGMLKNCTNLLSVPQINTSNATSMQLMFSQCSNLVTVPVLNTSNVTNDDRIFSSCPSLSDESLNNILQMCINMVKLTLDLTKTLKYIGLTQDQATRCQSLSNYQDLISAGWTTGY